MMSLVTGTVVALPERYTADAVCVLDADERTRLLDSAGRPRRPEQLPWELLYRIEPGLYARLVAGERLHEGILNWLPARCERVLEVGAGTGRLTLELARRCEHAVAVEPAAGLRAILEARLREVGAANVRVVRGSFDELPPADAGYDLVVSCSAFDIEALDHPDACLNAMESLCRVGGVLAVIWPGDVAWLRARGFEHVEFEGPMLVEYASVEEAAELARIFYPNARDAVEERQSRFVDFTTLGMSPPRGLCWKRRE